ncbi:MAG: hypothetical protein V2G48_07975 [bacterium JZ-2024 1]
MKINILSQKIILFILLLAMISSFLSTHSSQKPGMGKEFPLKHLVDPQSLPERGIINFFFIPGLEKGAEESRCNPLKYLVVIGKNRRYDVQVVLYTWQKERLVVSDSKDLGSWFFEGARYSHWPVSLTNLCSDHIIYTEVGAADFVPSIFLTIRDGKLVNLFGELEECANCEILSSNYVMASFLHNQDVCILYRFDPSVPMFEEIYSHEEEPEVLQYRSWRHCYSAFLQDISKRAWYGQNNTK